MGEGPHKTWGLMENPKKGASKSDLQSKSTLCFSPKAKPDTHTPMAERQTRRTASQKRCGWRPLELGPGVAGQSTNVLHQAHTPGPSAHKVPSTPFLSPTCSSDASGPLGPGQRDQNRQWSRTGSPDMSPPWAMES